MTTLANVLLVFNIICDVFLVLFFMVGFGLTMWEIRVNQRNGVTISIRSVALASAVFVTSLIFGGIVMLNSEQSPMLTAAYGFGALARLGLTIALIGLVKRLADEATRANR